MMQTRAGESRSLGNYYQVRLGKGSILHSGAETGLGAFSGLDGLGWLFVLGAATVGYFSFVGRDR